MRAIDWKRQLLLGCPDTYVELGDHEPQEEDGLEEEVEGEPVEENVGEGLEDRNESIDGPVRCKGGKSKVASGPSG